jgi:hypothetical protein
MARKLVPLVKVPASSPLGRVLSRLEGVKQVGPGQWSACCPYHDDHKASLSVADGQVLLHCHAGCDTEAGAERKAVRGIPSAPDPSCLAPRGSQPRRARAE